MYACGLTVYARGHIGNFRTFVSLDVLRRALKYVGGFGVRQVMNFTDVDDKTIAGAEREGLPLREYTERYIAAFHEDCAALGLEPVGGEPARHRPGQHPGDERHDRRARGSKGHTYRSDGSIYFKIATMPTYGKLARLDHDGIQAGARVDSDEYAKEDARDFVLWKATKPGEPTWDAGVGPGRPGWHIECSAMALRLLGEAPIDIHAGGIDLDLPAPRERDRAERRRDRQAVRARAGCTSSTCWSRTRRCRSRSATSSRCPTSSAKGFRASALRYLLLSAHYRKQLNFTWSGMAQAEEALRRWTDFLARLDTVTGTHARTPRWPRWWPAARAAFDQAMADDLNTAAALGEVFELVRALNTAIDQRRSSAGPTWPRVRDGLRRTSTTCSACWRCARRKTPRAGLPEAEIERLHSTIGRRRAAAATSPPPIAFAPSCSSWASFSKTGRKARAGNESRERWTRQHLKTSLPGPKAKALIERDGQVVSPSYTRDYPFVIARGEGATVEDVDGNVFLDCAAGIAVNSTGHSHPDGRGGDRRPGAEVPAHVGHRLLLRAAGEAG